MSISVKVLEPAFQGAGQKPYPCFPVFHYFDISSLHAQMKGSSKEHISVIVIMLLCFSFHVIMLIAKLGGEIS